MIMCRIALQVFWGLAKPDLVAKQVADDLRERSFGSLELQSHDIYVAVWKEDSSSEDYRPPGDCSCCQFWNKVHGGLKQNAILVGCFRKYARRCKVTPALT